MSSLADHVMNIVFTRRGISTTLIATTLALEVDDP